MKQFTVTQLSSVPSIKCTHILLGISQSFRRQKKSYELWFYYSRRYSSNAFTFCTPTAFVMTKASAHTNQIGGVVGSAAPKKKPFPL